MFNYMKLTFSYYSENKNYGKFYYTHIGEKVNITSKIGVLLYRPSTWVL